MWSLHTTKEKVTTGGWGAGLKLVWALGFLAAALSGPGLAGPTSQLRFELRFGAMPASLASATGQELCALAFDDQAQALGVSFRHQSGATGERHLPETMGAGVAWIDYDGDGWSDLYFVQSGEFPPQVGVGASDRLYRNLGPDAEGEFSFEDVTQQAGVHQVGYGQGVLALDYDGDGDSDLVISSFGSEVLLENQGGVFHERSLPAAPIPGGAVPWGASITAADVDHDSDLDLYVTRYLDYDSEVPFSCGTAQLADLASAPLGSSTAGASVTDAPAGKREYCDPSLFQGQRDIFWRNSVAKREVSTTPAPVASPGDDGSGFVLDTEAAGLRLSNSDVIGKGLGALFVDLNGDARPDLYVANDITPNHLFLNEGLGFRDDSLFSGTAVNGAGRSEAGMGLAVVDDDRDGDPDLLVTNFDVETNTLYRNQGDGFFEDHSGSSGFGLPSFNLLGFGLLAEDFDLDGLTDVFVANGHIFEQPKRLNVRYRQNDLFLRGGTSGFLPYPCVVQEPPKVSRGAASGDFDQDGDLDIVVTHVDDAPSILQTKLARAGQWLGVHLDGAGWNTEAIGSVVTWRQGISSSAGSMAGTQEHFRDHRWVVAGGSYLSSSSRALRFAVQADRPRELDVLTVQFASGKTVVIHSPPRGRTLRVKEEEQNR